jgi:cob(I)alamin adenosyltransferase
MEEFNNVVGNGYATKADVHKILNEKHEDLELVFTGRNATKELIEAADYVIEMKMIKHPAHSGMKARKGIEF